MRSRNKSRKTEADLDITSFMNLMVILIPFLLLNAVFTQVAVLQVSLPKGSDGGSASDVKKPLVLEVIVYKDRLIVADRQTGPMKTIPAIGTEHDFAGLNNYLREVKTQYPLVNDATVLLEPETAYDTMIQTMDAVRIIESSETGKPAKYALFPDVAIGDAPADPKAGGAA